MHLHILQCCDKALYRGHMLLAAQTTHNHTKLLGSHKLADSGSLQVCEAELAEHRESCCHAVFRQNFWRRQLCHTTCRYIKRAMHGTRMMTPSEIKDVYGRELVDLHKSRWHFLNTLFSVSEAVMYAQASHSARCRVSSNA